MQRSWCTSSETECSQKFSFYNGPNYREATKYQTGGLTLSFCAASERKSEQAMADNSNCQILTHRDSVTQ